MSLFCNDTADILLALKKYPFTQSDAHNVYDFLYQ